jgi:tetratricopeptide (TPR) repeat protein
MRKITLLFLLIFTFLVTNSLAQEKSIKEEVIFLLDSGKFKEAYELLLKEYPDKEGDIEILFLKGIAAFNLKDFDKAIEYFEAILAINPNLPRVKLELARAYAEKGKITEAKNLLKEVLKMEPPLTVRKNIELFLEMLEARKNWNFNFFLGYLYDDNVNAGPTVGEIELFGLPFKLEPKLRKQSDQGYLARFNFNYFFPFSSNLFLHTNFEFNSVTYSHLSAFNSQRIYFSLGPRRTSEHHLLSFPLLFEKLRRGSNDYSNTFGISPEFYYALTNNLIFITNACWTKKKYYLIEERSGSLSYLDFSLRRVFRNGFLQGGFRYIYENTKRDFLDNDIKSIYFGLYLKLPHRISLYLNPEFSLNNYFEKEAAFPEKRKDKIYLLNLNLSKEIGITGFSVTLFYTFTKHDSNLPLYEYKRNQIGFQFSKSF